jgi:hypothetical protein
MKRKKDNKFWPKGAGIWIWFEPQIFSNFPAHDLNIMESEEPEIKSKQDSKRNRTLLKNI